MPVRTYQRSPVGFHQSISVNGYDLESEDDIAKLNKSLVFLDLNTGLSNRGVIRDPICGLGDLPPEVDPLQGCALKHKTEETLSNKRITISKRDPILLEGDLGEEYDCFNSIKGASSNQRNNRNVITLEGDLGEELDNTKPYSGSSKSSIKNEPIRNPITGCGDFGLKEWDPIWKYDGKHVLNRPEQVKRDPLTHSVPMTNMGETCPKYLVKHFDITRDTDVISHDESIKDLHKSNQGYNSSFRHFQDREYRNPIVHDQMYGESEDKPHRAGTRQFYDKMKNDDPICHHGLSDDINEIAAQQDHARIVAQSRVTRDPIRHCGYEDDADPIRRSNHRGPVNLTQRENDDPIRHHGLTDDINDFATKQDLTMMAAQRKVSRDPIRHCEYEDDADPIISSHQRRHVNMTKKDETGEKIFGNYR